MNYWKAVKFLLCTDLGFHSHINQHKNESIKPYNFFPPKSIYQITLQLVSIGPIGTSRQLVHYEKIYYLLHNKHSYVVLFRQWDQCKQNCIHQIRLQYISVGLIGTLNQID